MNGKLTLLILRAPELSLKALERNLAEAGFDLLVGTDLQQAHRVLQQAPQIDVVLTDTVLPWGTWLDALQTVEASAPGTPVVVCTAEHSPALRDQVRERGAYYAEMEPYYPIAVQLLIHAALARRDHLRRSHGRLYGCTTAGRSSRLRVFGGHEVKFIVSFVVLAILAGCAGERSASGFRLPENGDPERGRTAFVELECHQCHPVAGVDLPPPSGDSKISLGLGGRVHEVRTDGYLVTSVIHPSHKIRRHPGVGDSDESPMPDYTDQMTVRQLVDIVAFLQSRYEVVPAPSTMY